MSGCDGGQRRETAELDAAKLDESSQRVLAAFAGRPAASRAHLSMEKCGDGSWSLLITIPSPTGDQRRLLSVWLDERRVPSIEFGGWHSHADLWDKDREVGLRRMLESMPADRLPCRVVDMTDQHEVLDELTDPTASREMKLLSWSGAEDSVLDESQGHRIDMVAADPDQPVLRLSIQSPHDRQLVVLEFVEYVAVGGDSFSRVLIHPCNSRGSRVGETQTVVLDNVADERAYAWHNTIEAMEGGVRVVRLECVPASRSSEPADE